MSSSSSGKQLQVSRKEQCGLLDLPDPLLVLILELVDDVVDVVRFGAVNRRLRSLPCLVRRLNTTISMERWHDELVLLRFLEHLACRGGCLRELNVCFKDPYLPLKKTDWESISQTLERLKLELRFCTSRYESCVRSWPEQDPFQHLLPRCTGLVNLELCGPGVGSFQPEVVQQLVASCPRLQSLFICYYEPCHLNFVSSSLEKIKLRISTGVSVTLDTPALTDLSYYSCGGELGIHSHALKRLMVKVGCEREFHTIGACPSTGNLEYLCIQDRSCLEDHSCLWQIHIWDILAGISGGCVDDLVFGPAFGFPVFMLRKLSLPALLEPLSRVRSLRISCKYLEDLVIDDETLNRLGVEEVVLDIRVEGDRLLVDPVSLLVPRILGSSSIQKVVIEWRTEYEGAVLRQVLKKPVEPDFAALTSELEAFRFQYKRKPGDFYL